MAIENPEPLQSVWDNPMWPDRLPNPKALRVLYGALADELVIRFDGMRYQDVAVVLITTPSDDYAGLLVEGDRGTVIGVHVYPLVGLAARHHPTWLAAVEPQPSPQVAIGIVNDIKGLFDRFGIEAEAPSRS
jgi:hypothetical protein